jgi:hypothetical protein
MISTFGKPRPHRRILLPMLAASLLGAGTASADAVTDWNAKTNDILAASGMGTPPQNRAIAIAQTATYEAVNAITKRYPGADPKLKAARGASVDAAIAAANRAVLSKLVPAQQPAIDAAYQAALGKIADGASKTAGIEVGEKAAAAVLASRAEDGAAAKESYRPATTPGAYVPTAIPATPHWAGRKPWLMKNGAQFRPAAPPALTSEAWAKDFNEIKTIGDKAGTKRTPEQTAIALFWETTAPTIYHGIVRSVAAAPGRDITRNARLLAAAAQAADDALIAVMDAKYHYSFWRPVTAIRNADNDNNNATERDPSWLPLVDAPMHPEYPCAHCIIASSMGAVLTAEIGKGPAPQLSTTSPSAKGAQRTWKTVDEFVQEVSNARIWSGVHYRNSTAIGNAMGKQIGALAVSKHLK